MDSPLYVQLLWYPGFELTGGLGGLNPPTSTFQTHYFSKNIDLIDKKPFSTPPPHLLTIRPLLVSNVLPRRDEDSGKPCAVIEAS